MEISENRRRGSARARRAVGSAGGSRFQRLIEVWQVVIAIAGIGVFLDAGVSAAAQKLCVDPLNTACSATIQAAVDLAKKNAVITVVAGTFFENVAINTGTTPKTLKLVIQGAGAGTTIVDGGSAGIVFTVGREAALTLANRPSSTARIPRARGLAAA